MFEWALERGHIPPHGAVWPNRFLSHPEPVWADDLAAAWPIVLAAGGDPRPSLSALRALLQDHEGRRVGVDDIRAAHRSFTTTLAAATVCLVQKTLADDDALNSVFMD